MLNLSKQLPELKANTEEFGKASFRASMVEAGKKTMMMDGVIENLEGMLKEITYQEKLKDEGIQVIRSDDIKDLFSTKEGESVNEPVLSVKKEDPDFEVVDAPEVPDAKDKELEHLKDAINKNMDSAESLEKRKLKADSPYKFCPAGQRLCDHFLLANNKKKYCQTSCGEGPSNPYQRVEGWTRCPCMEKMLNTYDPFEDAYEKFRIRLEADTTDTQARDVFIEIIKQNFNPISQEGEKADA